MSLRAKLIVGILLVLIAASFIPAFQASHEASRRMTCDNNLKSIAVALASYHNAYHSLPLAVERASDGKLWRSWRSQIYPVYMEQIGMFYDTTSSWDSPSNMRLLDGSPVRLGHKDGTSYTIVLDKVPWPFCCPTSKENSRGGTSYVTVVGDETAFPKNRAIAMSEISDGLENTIIVVESINCRPDWTEPRDLEFASMSFRINDLRKPSISSDHTGGALVCFAEGEVAFITERVTEDEVRAMLTIAGGETVLRRDLSKRGVLSMRQTCDN